MMTHSEELNHYRLVASHSVKNCNMEKFSRFKLKSNKKVLNVRRNHINIIGIDGIIQRMTLPGMIFRPANQRNKM